MIPCKPSEKTPCQPDGDAESCCNANEDALPVVGDDAVGLEGQESGDEDEEHDVDQGQQMVLKLIAHKRGHVEVTLVGYPCVMVTDPFHCAVVCIYLGEKKQLYCVI